MLAGGVRGVNDFVIIAMQKMHGFLGYLKI